jgi:TfoX/Sxy family transcriptional regulator of competence genes
MPSGPDASPPRKASEPDCRSLSGWSRMVAMAYDEELAGRLRRCLSGTAEVVEKRMFGGLGFMVAGNMAVSASSQGGLLLRADPDQVDIHLAEPGVERFVMRGRAMDGWLRVDGSAVESDEALARWVAVGVARAQSLA